MTISQQQFQYLYLFFSLQIQLLRVDKYNIMRDILVVLFLINCFIFFFPNNFISYKQLNLMKMKIYLMIDDRMLTCLLLKYIYPYTRMHVTIYLDALLLHCCREAQLTLKIVMLWFLVLSPLPLFVPAILCCISRFRSH